jgi:protoporphyrinogen oxidase
LIPVADPDVLIIGAGPAGLTAAYCLTRHGTSPIILEASGTVGGLSRTVEYNGWRFDLGGHRFFTKVDPVKAIWHELLSDEEFPQRPRLSRIYYGGRFFDYPLRFWNAVSQLGIGEAALCSLSYLLARIRASNDRSSFEAWMTSRFGVRLYRTFFKTYTEKVWGLPASEIQADWAEQRIRNLSLGKAGLDALLPRSRRASDATSLTNRFHYPKYGAGMMWERARDIVVAHGGTVLLNSRVEAVHRSSRRAVAVTAQVEGIDRRFETDEIISSMPLGELIEAVDPPPPRDVLAAAASLRHRGLIIVALIIPAGTAFPDNWIYVHSPTVRVARIENFGTWSPYMASDERTCLCLEYFVWEADDLWQLTDERLIELAKRELARLGLADTHGTVEGYVVRVPKAYPVYDGAYRRSLETVRAWLDDCLANVHPVGRNGMHRYNNQDHSMLTAMLTVENICGASHDVWNVNMEADYHEEVQYRHRGRARELVGRVPR